MTETAWPLMGSTGEAILFSCVAVVMVLGALGVLFFKKAAYSAICMVAVMIGLAVLFIALGAPFLGAVKVVVYTGAIMMLFLCVIMMIGLGATDGYQFQSRGAITDPCIGGLGMIAIFAGIAAKTVISASKASSVDPYSNEPVTSLASSLFADHWMSMELAGTLLITAAIGAMLLTHTDRLGPSFNQRTTAEAKMKAFKESGRHIGQLPAPGVFAHSNATDVPAIGGDTLAPVEDSVPRVFRVRGLGRSLNQVAPDIAESLQLTRAGLLDDSPFKAGKNVSVPRSGAWGMPGPSAPTGLNQPEASAADRNAQAETSANEADPKGMGEVQTAPDAGQANTDHVQGPGANAGPTQGGSNNNAQPHTPGEGAAK